MCRIVRGGIRTSRGDGSGYGLPKLSCGAGPSPTSQPGTRSRSRPGRWVLQPTTTRSSVSGVRSGTDGRGAGRVDGTRSASTTWASAPPRPERGHPDHPGAGLVDRPGRIGDRHRQSGAVAQQRVGIGDHGVAGNRAVGEGDQCVRHRHQPGQDTGVAEDLFVRRQQARPVPLAQS